MRGVNCFIDACCSKCPLFEKIPNFLDTLCGNVYNQRRKITAIEIDLSPSSSMVRTRAFQACDTGSNPVGDAKIGGVSFMRPPLFSISLSKGVFEKENLRILGKNCLNESVSVECFKLMKIYYWMIGIQECCSREV